MKISNNQPHSGRTLLHLDEGREIPLPDELCLSFEILVKENEVPFGNIVNLQFSNGNSAKIQLFDESNGCLYPLYVVNDEVAARGKMVDDNVWLKYALAIRRQENSILFDIDQHSMPVTIPIADAESVKITFGYDTPAPCVIHDIHVYADGEFIRHWSLDKHDGDVSYDSIASVGALAVNPDWMVDRHVRFTNIFTRTFQGNVDVIYNPKRNQFYIVTMSQVITISHSGKVIGEHPVRSGQPVDALFGRMLWNPVSRNIVSYSLDRNEFSVYDFDKMSWSGGSSSAPYSSPYKQAKAYDPATNSYYVFGGYGYHHYKNQLYRIDLGDEPSVTEIEYDQMLMPRASSAATLVDGKLYVFGGMGNKDGIDGLPVEHTIRFDEIDLATGNMRKLWRLETDDNFVMAHSLIYNKEDSTFLAFAYNHGGEIWKFRADRPGYELVSEPIGDIQRSTDADFSFYESADGMEYFAVLNLILYDGTHLLRIYSIKRPLLTLADTVQHHEVIAEKSSSRWIVLIITTLLVAAGAFYIVRRRRRKPEVEATEPDLPSEPDAGQPAADSDADETLEADVQKYPSVNLLGAFNLYTRDGEQITGKLTPRAKELFLMVFLYTSTTGTAQATTAYRALYGPTKTPCRLAKTATSRSPACAPPSAKSVISG